MATKKKKEKLTDDYLLSLAQDQFTRSQNWRFNQVDERWEKDNDLYNSKFSKKEKGASDVLLGQGRLFIPKTYSYTQRMLVDILDTFFFDHEEIVSIDSWKSVPSQVREIVKTLINYRLNGHPINFYHEAYEACLNALKNKVGIFKVYPKLKTEKKKNKAGEEEEVLTEFCPIIENLPYEDVFFSPQATWKDYWKYPIVHRMRRSIDYLKRRGYKNLDGLEPINDSIGTDIIKNQRVDYNTSPFTDDLKVSALGEVYIYEHWTFLDVNNDGLLESCSYLTAGDAQGPQRIIRDVEENELPYKKYGEDYNRPPIVMGSAFPEAHQLYGKSLPEITEGLQRETNAIRNQRREAVALALRKPILVQRGANIDLMSLVNRRIGGITLGDDISDSSVRELQISDPTVSSIQEQARTDQDYSEATSIPPNLLGMPSSSDETATAVTAHTANANKKIQLVIKNLAQTLFIPAFEMLLRLEQTYESDGFIAMVTGRKLGWLFIDDNNPPTEYIQGDFGLNINIGMNKQVQLNKWMLLMDRGNQANATQMQMVMGGVVNPQAVSFIDTMKIFKKVLPIVGEKDIDEFMVMAQQPPMPEGGSAGMPSQTKMPMDVSAEVTNMNPEMMQGGYGRLPA